MNLKNLKYLFFLLMTVFVLSSCSETDEDESKLEYADWQARNDKAFADTLAYARQQGEANGWYVFRNWSLDNQTPNKDTNGNEASLTYNDDDYIVVHVLHKGEGTESPLYTDSIQVSYRGRLLPSTSYADGYVFDQTFEGTYSSKTAKPTKTTVNYGWIDGYTTALLKMHVGDRWMVFIPQNLGYGTTDNNGIPAYSLLRFELVLNGYKRGSGAWVTQ